MLLSVLPQFHAAAVSSSVQEKLFLTEAHMATTGSQQPQKDVLRSALSCFELDYLILTQRTSVQLYLQ
jgi:hypothetical protein